MGTLRSVSTDVKGYTYNGVVLGDPAEIDGDPATYEFDHQAFPNGTVELVDDEIVVVPDDEEVE